MKVCAGCTHEYNEDFKHCPECGRKFGGGQENDDYTAKLNAGLSAQVRSANREAMWANQMRQRPLDGTEVTGMAREAASVLIEHDPGIAAMVKR